MLAEKPTSSLGWGMSLSLAVALAALGGFAGWGVSAVARVAAAAISDHSEYVSRSSEQLAAHSAHAIALLQRISEALEARAESRGAPHRANSQSSDPGAGRQVEIHDLLAQLEAAQEVNDPGRVLELYEGLAAALDAPARAALRAKIAPWFLTMIHRRLRTGKIQADVVQLAGRFAEAFATTREGASVRASLPMLRRSVGLCSRCAQPYTGLAEACPRCLGGGTAGTASTIASPESAESD
jgi:hypothetical protein